MWTANAALGPCRDARTLPTHHLAVKSARVGCFLLLRNHLVPSPDCRGRSVVAARYSPRMARSSVARVAATTVVPVNCWLVRPRRWRSFQMVWRNVTRKTHQSKRREGGGYQIEGSPVIKTEGCRGGGWPLICRHRSHNHLTAGRTAGHSQNACTCVSSGLFVVECVPTRNPTVPMFITWAPIPAHAEAGHRHPTMPAAFPLLIMPGRRVDPRFNPLCRRRHAKWRASLSRPACHRDR